MCLCSNVAFLLYYLHIYLIYIYTSVDLRRQGRRVIRLVGPLSILRPTPKSSKRTQKYAVPAVTRSPLCRDADVPEWQASLWEGDKRVDAKEISKPCSFPSSALHLLLVTCIHDNASAEEKSSINYMGDAFYNKKMQFSCVWYELDRESRAEPSTLCMDHLWTRGQHVVTGSCVDCGGAQLLMAWIVTTLRLLPVHCTMKLSWHGNKQKRITTTGLPDFTWIGKVAGLWRVWVP